MEEAYSQSLHSYTVHSKLIAFACELTVGHILTLSCCKQNFICSGLPCAGGKGWKALYANRASGRASAVCGMCLTVKGRLESLCAFLDSVINKYML